MKLIYIAGRYRGNGTPDNIYENIQIARKYAKKYWGLGYAVFCPHLNSGLMDGALPDEVFLAGGIEILNRCDIIVMLPGWSKSPGSVKEVAFAATQGLEIIYEEEMRK